ncbi:MAG TPA: response regulator [Thermoanaerobaculia bacterium]|nr:response regulator [Thermoanaerobaculia bacterium]
MRLLVVDHDSALTALMVALFRRHDFVIDTAADGEEAIEKIRGTDYSTILLDLMLPRMNGFEVIREMKSFAPEVLRRTIVITAASNATLRHFDRSEVFELIRKPFELDELVSSVERCGEGARAAGLPLDGGAKVPSIGSQRANAK